MSKTKTFVFVQGDTNDADYVSQLTEVKGWDFDNQKMTENDLINLVKKVGEIVKKQGRHNNWDNSDYGEESNRPTEMYKGKLTEEEIGLFEEIYVPHGSDGIHTINEIKILEVSKLTNIL